MGPELPRDFLAVFSQAIGMAGTGFVMLAAIITAVRSSGRPELHRGMVLLAIALSADAVLVLCKIGVNMLEFDPELHRKLYDSLSFAGLLFLGLTLVAFLMVKPPPEAADG